MSIRSISHVNFHAHRELMDAMKDFYCDVVGLEIGPRPNFAMPGYWLYAGGEPLVHLYQATPEEVREPGAPATFDHVAFTCEDCAAVEAKLRARSAQYRKVTVPGTKVVQIFLTDPARNTVELNFQAGEA